MVSGTTRFNKYAKLPTDEEIKGLWVFVPEKYGQHFLAIEELLQIYQLLYSASFSLQPS